MAATFGDVIVELSDDGVALVEMNRPPDNFFDVELIGSLADAFTSIADDGGRAIVLTSRGKNFCAGANFSAAGGGFEGERDGIPSLYREASRMMRTPVPIIAAIQGAAVGGGLGVACAADFRVATPLARFSANFARLGFHQGFALSVTLPAIVGRQMALDLLYTGRRISGEHALAIGLIDELVAPEELLSAARMRAEEISRSAPLAVRSIRATLRAPMLADLDAAFQREADEQARLRLSDDWREGVKAMAERREPHFEGR